MGIDVVVVAAVVVAAVVVGNDDTDGSRQGAVIRLKKCLQSSQYSDELDLDSGDANICRRR